MQVSENSTIQHNTKNIFLGSMLLTISNKLKDIFQPEVVEVTITGTGNNRSYTYTKIAKK